MSKNAFHQIGYQFQGPQQMAQFIEKHAAESNTIPTPVGGAYSVLTTANCAQIIAQYDPQHHLIGCLPHIAGNSAIEAKISDTLEDPRHPLDGIVLADFVSTDVPFAFDCPMYRVHQQQLLPERVHKLQICAFPMQAEVFKNEKQFKKSPYGKFASDGCFIPNGLFRPDNKPVEKPMPFAIMTGTVTASHHMKNKLTKRTFWHCELATYGGSITTAFDASDVKVKPTKGTLLGGTFRLSALPVAGS